MISHRVMLMVGFMTVLSTGLRAEEGAARNIEMKKWAEKLQARLARLERQKQPITVAAVRGEEKKPQSSGLYWKKPKKQMLPAPDELQAFKSAVKTLEDGKREEAAAAFKTFLASYPKSPLADEAKSSLEMLTQP